MSLSKGGIDPTIRAEGCVKLGVGRKRKRMKDPWSYLIQRGGYSEDREVNMCAACSMWSMIDV